MKFNSYVYPYTPFIDLSDKTTRWTLTEQKILDASDIQGLLASLPKLEPKISGLNEAEKILSIFLDEEVLFGPAEFITDLKQDWLDALNRFIDKGDPIQFTLLGFPFKVPVRLKTDRTMPDMGELLILHRLYAITQAIQTIYPTGAVIHIFTEGAFGPFVGVAEGTAAAYAEALQKMTSDFGFDERIKVRALSEMEDSVPDFDKLFADKLSVLRAKYSFGDQAFMKKFDGAYDSIQRIVATDMYTDEVAMDAYDESLDDSQLSADALAARRDIRSRATETVLKYHTYLEIRDDIGFLQMAVPDGLALTVSPKPKRLGIIPINRQCERLPYHGVAVFHQKTNSFTIEYLVDLKREPQRFTPTNYRQEAEDKPFFYSV